MNIQDLKIGSKIWRFDGNRRVYPEKRGYMHEPIWTEHWVECEIVGGTSRSWVLSGYGGKIPKKGPLPRGFALDRHRINNMAYVKEHRYWIGRAVQQLDLDQFDLLKKIADLVGYKAEEGK